MLPDLLPMIEELERLRRGGTQDDEHRQLELEIPADEPKEEEVEDCEVDYEVYF